MGMRATRPSAPAAVNDAIELNQEIVDRANLTRGLPPGVVDYYVMTRGAARAWAAVNRQLPDRHGALFWIGGPAGSGKTQFVNYVLALSERAAALHESGRHLTLAFPSANQMPDLSRAIAEAIVGELGANSDSIKLWRKLDGSDVLRVVLDQAKRQGVVGLTVAIDFGDAELNPQSPVLAVLIQLAVSGLTPKMTVIAAGRSNPLDQPMSSFAVSPQPDEEPAVIIGSARRLDATTKVPIEAYQGLTISEDEAVKIYPFHPAAAAALARFGREEKCIATGARIARDALAAWRLSLADRALIKTVDLMRIPLANAALEQRLGETGRAALQSASAAASGIEPPRTERAADVVLMLALHHLASERRPLVVNDLHEHLTGRTGSAAEVEELSRLLAEIAALSEATIVWDRDNQAAGFNPEAAGAPQIASFNSALPIIRRFNASLNEVATPSQLKGALARLQEGMAARLEEAERNRRILRQAAQEFGSNLSRERESTLAEMIALAGGGTRGLLAACGQAETRAGIARTIQEYETLATLASAAPQLRAMREYLFHMGLTEPIDDPDRPQPLIRIESECKLLLVDLAGALQAKSAAALDALESRFQRFKWTYVPYYRASHEDWRREMERAANLIEDARQYVAGLARLNAIAALGAAVGVELQAELAELEKRVLRCDADGPLAPEVTPLCPRCHFVIGTASPTRALDELGERARRALTRKLVLLSQSAVTRLIEEHDSSRRLEGLLKIIQAAQTDALIRVLDDQLAAYLAQMLIDVPGTTADVDSRAIRPIQPVDMGLASAAEERKLGRETTKLSEPGSPRTGSKSRSRRRRGS